MAMSKRDKPGSVPLPKKKSKDKSGEAHVLSIKFNKPATKDSVECECCFNWEIEFVMVFLRTNMKLL